MEQYYTPSLEDLYVGYKYEYKIHIKGQWQNYVLKDLCTDRDGYGATEVQDYLEAGLLRTKYLTKEQIEAEGWKGNGNFDVMPFYKDNYYLMYNFQTHMAEIIINDMSKYEGIKCNVPKYYGS